MNIELILGIIFSVLAMIAIYAIKIKTNNPAYATLTALGLGIVIGLIFKENILFLDTIGKGYMSLVKMIVIPLVMISLINSILKLKNLETLKSIGVKTIGLLLGTTGIAGAIGVVVALSLNLGQGIGFEGAGDFVAREVPKFSQVFLDMLPSNPVSSMVEGKIIPIIIFSLFIAVALIIEDDRNNERVKIIKDFVVSTHYIINRITKMVLELLPYGVFALLAKAIAKNGVDTLMSLIWVIAAVYIACILQFLIVYIPIITGVAKKNPIKFFKAISPAQIVAFTSQSSYGTLPVLIKSLVERAGVSENVASFVSPIGASMGMNACGGLYPAIVAIFVANVFNIDLTIYSYVLIVLTTIIGSLGVAGVPGAATMSTTVVLATMGLPLEGMAIVMAVDPVIDMMRTMTNVTGAAVTALVVDETEKRKLEKNGNNNIKAA